VIGNEFTLSDTRAALELVGGRHARGKIVVKVP
jgi:NADPH:quinone reductase-like Zn-dependent oxidoreductase